MARALSHLCPESPAAGTPTLKSCQNSQRIHMSPSSCARTYDGARDFLRCCHPCRPARRQCKLPLAARHLILRAHQRFRLPLASHLLHLRCFVSQYLEHEFLARPVAHRPCRRQHRFLNQLNRRLHKRGLFSFVRPLRHS